MHKNLHISKIFIFLKTHKNIGYQNFDPPPQKKKKKRKRKIKQGYVYVKNNKKQQTKHKL